MGASPTPTHSSVRNSKEVMFASSSHSPGKLTPRQSKEATHSNISMPFNSRISREKMGERRMSRVRKSKAEKPPPPTPEQETAAVKIQGLYRSKTAKGVLNDKKTAKVKAEEEAEERWTNAHIFIREAAASATLTMAVVEEIAAATMHREAARIQSVYRGKSTRREQEQRRRKEQQEQEEAQQEELALVETEFTLEEAEATKLALTSKLEAEHILLPAEIEQLEKLASLVAHKSANSLLAKVEDGQLLDPGEAETLREATFTLASTTAARIASKLANGRMLDADELEALKTSAKTVACLKAEKLAAKLADGHILSDDELADLKDATLGAARWIPTPPVTARSSTTGRSNLHVSDPSPRALTSRPVRQARSTKGLAAGWSPRAAAHVLAREAQSRALFERFHLVSESELTASQAAMCATQSRASRIAKRTAMMSPITLPPLRTSPRTRKERPPLLEQPDFYFLELHQRNEAELIRLQEKLDVEGATKRSDREDLLGARITYRQKRMQRLEAQRERERQKQLEAQAELEYQARARIRFMQGPQASPIKAKDRNVRREAREDLVALENVMKEQAITRGEEAQRAQKWLDKELNALEEASGVDINGDGKIGDGQGAIV